MESLISGMSHRDSQSKEILSPIIEGWMIRLSPLSDILNESILSDRVSTQSIWVLDESMSLNKGIFESISESVLHRALNKRIEEITQYWPKMRGLFTNCGDLNSHSIERAWCEWWTQSKKTPFMRDQLIHESSIEITFIPIEWWRIEYQRSREHHSIQWEPI